MEALINQGLWWDLRKMENHGRPSENKNNKSYQHGVPTKVFLERCLSPVSNMHADTPKSANLTAPLESIKIFPACKPMFRNINKNNIMHSHMQEQRKNLKRRKNN